jgi:Ca2+-binding RTX toxin-like protein
MPIQAVDSIQTSTPGVTFTADFQTWIIAPDVVVGSANQFGVLSNREGSNLVNYGSIFTSALGGNDDAVRLLGDDAIFLNQTGGAVAGASGVGLDGSSSVLRNFGSITGILGSGVYVADTALNVLLVNDGHIHGHQAGVTVFSEDGGPLIRNFGTIESVNWGVIVAAAPNVATEIINLGTIRGLVDAIYLNEGGIVLINRGTLDGGIAGRSDNESADSIRNTGLIDGHVFLRGGGDFFDGRGGVVTGKVFGLQGDDRLIGGSGDDTMSGGNGADILTGGGGSDRFDFDSIPDAVDTIRDFQPTIDKIVLWGDVFTEIDSNDDSLPAEAFHIGRRAADGDDRIIYWKGTGALFYDPDGNGAAAAIRFATLARNLAIDQGDFLIG